MYIADEHAQVIEDALYALKRELDVTYESASAQQREHARIDAALAALTQPAPVGEWTRLDDDVRLFRRRQVAQEEWMDAPRFSHRNGESEPPAQMGRYWCKGVVVVGDDSVDLAHVLMVVDWHNNSMFAQLPNGRFVFVVGKDIVFPSGKWDCRWWGPVQAPWHEPPS